MPTQAISANGTALRIGDGVPLTALTLTAATNATPIVITTSTNHNVVDVSYGTISGVAGAAGTGANGSFVVERVTNTTLKLRGSIGTGAYTSGGSLVLESTFATIAEVRNIQDAGFTLGMVEVSALDGGGWSSSIPIIKRGKAVRIDINLIPHGPTHDHLTGLIFLGLNRISRPFLMVFPNATKAATRWVGFTTDHGTNAPADNALQAQVTFTVDTAMTWSVA
jgi:hypothetical protein